MKSRIIEAPQESLAVSEVESLHAAPLVLEVPVFETKEHQLEWKCSWGQLEVEVKL